MYLSNNNNNYNNQVFSRNIQSLFQMIEAFLNQYLAERATEYSPFYGNYNLERMTESSYRLSLNVAGFKKNDITINLYNNYIEIKGNMSYVKNNNFLHQGISSNFYNKFSIPQNAEITNATLVDGILQIDIKEVNTAGSLPNFSANSGLNNYNY